MPAKTSPFWRARTFEAFENANTRAERSSGRVAIRLSQLGADYPKERTITTLRREWEALTETERSRYQQVRWPESFGSKYLPWGAAAALRPLLERAFDTGRRPLLAEALWYWRLREAAPYAPYEVIADVAARLAALELLGFDGEAERRAVEAWIAYAPWRSIAATRAYRQAVEAGRATRGGGVMDLTDVEEGEAAELLAMVRETSVSDAVALHRYLQARQHAAD